MLSSLQNVLVDSHDPPALSLPQDPPRKPQELDIEQALLAPIGESSPQPHLLVRFLYSLICLRLMRYYTAGVFAIGPARNLRGAFWRHTTRTFRTCASLESEYQVCENLVKDVRDPASGRKREKHHRGTKTHFTRVYTVCHDPYVREYLIRRLFHRRSSELDPRNGQKWGPIVSVGTCCCPRLHAVFAVGIKRGLFALFRRGPSRSPVSYFFRN
jgi:hypothetical protein